MIEWPDSLVREIGRRRAFFFLGAGASASAAHIDGDAPQTWDEFMCKACELITDGSLHTEVTALIRNKSYLIALQAIKENVDPSSYDDLIDKSFNDPKFKASNLHEHILDLDLQIVVTTNFDKIYESYCQYTSEEGYRVLTYKSEDLGDLLRSDIRLIIKAHGCINDSRSMIFTRAQYHKAKKDYQHFYELLKAIFLTHTCIFVGCSMDDPDILLALEDVKITSSSTYPHYVLMRNGDSSELAKNDWKNTYNIKALEYGPEHSNLNLDLKNLCEKVIEFRSLY